MEGVSRPRGPGRPTGEVQKAGPRVGGQQTSGGPCFSASPGTLMWYVRGGQERFLGARGLDVADRAQSMTPGSSGHVAGASCAPRPLPPDTVTRPHMAPPPPSSWNVADRSHTLRAKAQPEEKNVRKRANN